LQIANGIDRVTCNGHGRQRKVSLPPRLDRTMLAEYVPVLLTVAICLFARPIGDWLGVVDHPDDLRKQHPDPTPLVGGIAIMVPVCVWSILKLYLGNDGASGLELVILLCGGGVAVLGFIDDQRMISPTGRLILLAIFAVVAVKLDPQLFVTHIDTFAIGSFPVLPAVSIILVVLAIAGFSSAVNMVDGVNGLVLSLVGIWSLCLATRGGLAAEASELLVAASFVTLLFNISGRLFLGDCGAFAISFTLGLITIAAHNEGGLPLETVVVWFLLPVADCLRLIPLRLMEGRSPFRPDRNHFHHRLAARIGEPRAIFGYVGLVALTSLVATWKPGLWAFCVCLDAVFYIGFLFADALTPAVAAAPPDVAEDPNVVRLRGERRRDS
jgi:UDP-GlcNAc:undecaprenyl-phosphate GlcNAc-1-phosphate transferase